MLTFMPPTPPLPVHTPMSRSTMSLAILPSSAPMAYSQSSGPTLLAPSPSPAKRPKLSLNTANVPTVFGKGSTSLRLDTLSASSPTTRNTFRNAYNQAQSQQTTSCRPPKPRLAPLATNVSNLGEQTSRIDCEETTDSAASSTSTSSTVSSVDFSTAEVPYRVAYNVRSILVNSPIPRKPTRITSFAQSKPMFPATKKVAFRAPLTEDIQTTKYTMKHSDIESSTSTISTLELSPPEEAPATNEEAEQPESTVEVEKKGPSSPQTGDKRESSDEEEDTDSCPATPVAGRNKRHREWRWTLGPIGPSNDHHQQQQRKETDNADQQSNGV